MEAIIRTKAFQDEKCICNCGNTHEYYGGKGYTTVYCMGYSDGRVDGGVYVHEVECNGCGEIHTLKF